MKLKAYRYKLAWLIVPLVIVVVDQISKYWAYTHLPWNGPVAIMSGLNLTLMYNLGAAFSFFASQMGWQRWVLSLVAIIVCLCISIWFVRLKRQQVLLHFALMCILGGAIGNLIDRAYHGYVIDFIDFYYRHWHWYTFNIADAAISLGAGLLLLDAALEGKKK